MDHHCPADLLQPVAATLKRVAESLNVVRRIHPHADLMVLRTLPIVPRFAIPHAPRAAARSDVNVWTEKRKPAGALSDPPRGETG